MTAQRWTGSSWASLPQVTPTAESHDCPGDLCRRCNAAIEAAEYETEHGWADHGDEMDDRAEREVRR